MGERMAPRTYFARSSVVALAGRAALSSAPTDAHFSRHYGLSPDATCPRHEEASLSRLSASRASGLKAVAFLTGYACPYPPSCRSNMSCRHQSVSGRIRDSQRHDNGDIFPDIPDQPQHSLDNASIRGSPDSWFPSRYRSRRCCCPRAVHPPSVSSARNQVWRATVVKANLSRGAPRTGARWRR